MTEPKCKCTWEMNNNGKYCKHCCDLLIAEGIEKPFQMGLF